MIQCTDLADFAATCANLFKEGITFLAYTATLKIELKGY
jgi:hypothetical protein